MSTVNRPPRVAGRDSRLAHGTIVLSFPSVVLLDRPFPRTLRLRLKLYLRYSGVPQAGGLVFTHSCTHLLTQALTELTHLHTPHTHACTTHSLLLPPTPAHTFKYPLAHPHTHAWTTLLHPLTRTLIHTPSCAPSQS